MKNQPLVSVIVPAYNAEKYLDETIRSVLVQTHRNWELIIVDDGSKDGTAAIAKKYAAADKRIFYCYQENQRMASARNIGIKRARGKYIAFLDADNLFLPKKLELQVGFLETHPECGICYARILHFYDQAPNVFYKNKNELPLSDEDQFRELLSRNAINVLSVLVRKELFDKYGAFQQGSWGCDEHYVWINLARRGVRFCYDGRHVVGLLRLHAAEDSRRREFMLYTARDFLRLLDTVASSLSPEEKNKYAGEFKRLRRAWLYRLFIGELINGRLSSWLFFPLFLRRRESNYQITDVKPD